MPRFSEGEKNEMSKSPCSESSVHSGLSQKPLSAVDWMATGRVALAFGLKPEELHSASRGYAKAAQARQVSMYILHVSMGMTLSQAGAVFGRDRTTAAHACKVVEDLREDPKFDAVLSEIEGQLSASVASARMHSSLSSGGQPDAYPA
ncbi:Chromosomal replication initiator protein DnaA [Pseudovibrio sp. Ad46]|nr:Chromosomal replication initiator protein DnaA [Pseudovibrio sp. Ad46]KZK92156.1 Chromosomal replication initiator protein DnaA [Pseudovibrio sp. Ad5]KZK94917.1 Chromosomal replication initiator protein DnaA [Pseudovibrio sp. W74]KZL08721.1 Chromosomal replication initiator protein DnaA [Pseudovibrio sp. Ad14]